MTRACASLLFLAACLIIAVAGQNCNCPGTSGPCNLNCSSPSGCCGSGTMDPTCYSPSAAQCCSWYDAARTCSLGLSCCGEMGPGASSVAFCCDSGSTCCKATGGGMSTCCLPGQICCGGYDAYCCDAQSEQCDQYLGECVPKTLPPPGPNPEPGQRLWNINLGAAAHTPVLYNSTHLIACGMNTYLVEKTTGKMTLIANTSNTIFRPIVKKHLLYVFGFFGTQLFAIDVNQMKVLWTSVASPAGSMLLANGVIFLGGTALRARDGKVLWSSAQGTAVATTADGNTVFLLFGSLQDSVVQARDTQTGALRFKVSAFVPVNGATPVVVDGVLIVPPATAYNATTGQRLWQRATSITPMSWMVPGPGVVAVASPTASYLEVINVTSGAVILDVPESGRTIQPCAVSSDLLYVCTNVTDQAFALPTGNKLWTVDLDGGSSYLATESRGAIYVAVALETNLLFAIDAVNGKVLQQYTAEGLVLGMVTDRKALYFGDNNGYLSAIQLVK